jgi:hypothetical protein
VADAHRPAVLLLFEKAAATQKPAGNRHYTRAVIEAAYCFAEACGYSVLTTASSSTGQRTIHHEARPFVCRGLPTTKATKASGSCSSTSGDPLAAAARDPGGVTARLLLGIAAALAV